MHDTRSSIILGAVGEQNYQKAIDLLTAYPDAFPEYPIFRKRSLRFANHAVELVNGFKAKKTFAASPNLPKAKVQEFHEKANRHLEDLRATLEKIEKIEHLIRIEDVRSTVWVVHAIVHCTLAVLAVAFLTEMSRGVLPSAGIIFDDAFTKVTDLVFNRLGI